MVPSSVTNRKKALEFGFFGSTRNSDVALKTARWAPKCRCHPVGIVTTKKAACRSRCKESGKPGAVGHPPRAAASTRETPGIHEIRIRVGCGRRSRRRISGQVSAMIQLSKSQPRDQHGHAGDGDNHSTNHRNPHTGTSTGLAKRAAQTTALLWEQAHVSPGPYPCLSRNCFVSAIFLSDCQELSRSL